MKADPKVVQEVSAATDNLLESLGALAVEVNERVQIRVSGVIASKVQPTCL